MLAYLRYSSSLTWQKDELIGFQMLQDFLNQTKEADEVSFTLSEMDFQLENIKDLIEDLQGSNDCSRPSWR